MRRSLLSDSDSAWHHLRVHQAPNLIRILKLLVRDSSFFMKRKRTGFLLGSFIFFSIALEQPAVAFQIVFVIGDLLLPEGFI